MPSHAKRALRGATFTLTLPKQMLRIKQENDALKQQVEDLMRANHHLFEELKGTKNHYDSVLAKIEHRANSADGRISDLLHQLTSLSKSGKKAAKGQSSSKEVLADNHLLDKFYVEFENNFRGTKKEITERLETYVPLMKKTVKATGGAPILDIGCGRGEFVDLMTKNKLRSIGLDLNEAMVKHIIDNGGEAVEQDALSYLREQKASSLAAITGFHIVEHIPFGDLVELFDECYRTLAPGGIILFETPNPENLVVGAHTFYMDPSHLHPIPPALLEFAVKQRGFSEVEILRLHPRQQPKAPKQNKLIDDIATYIYGPRDYAVIGRK